MRPPILRDDARSRAAAIDVLRAGGIVALPTDTVYGIACDLGAPGGVERLFTAKHRPTDRAIMLLLADAGQASAIGQIGPAAALTAGVPTIGLRTPDHPTPRELARAVGPLPTTSANISGRPQASDPAVIADELGDGIDLVLDGGPAAGGPASTVVDCTTDRPRILRAGAVDPADLAAALGAAGLAHDLLADPSAPG